MTDRPSSDCYLASFPRSGNTWVRFILANLMTGNRVDIDFHNYHLYVPDMHVTPDPAQWLAHPPFPRVIKTHDLPKPAYANAIYLVRDPRAALLSYWYYEGKPCPLETYFASDRQFWPASWDEHVSQWLQFAESNHVLVIRYEDLMEQPVDAVAQMVSHLGVQDITSGDIELAIARSDLEQMKAIEKDKGFWKPLKSESFVRQGKANAWKKELPDELSRAIAERYAGLMERFGYS